ncbi:hypothetical protein EJ110_NYTH01328 [Nymphaea thermarum]|nr:hypothetical protein EJ110_NYTH01328 [Nymphaea thermarum]
MPVFRSSCSVSWREEERGNAICSVFRSICLSPSVRKEERGGKRRRHLFRLRSCSLLPSSPAKKEGEYCLRHLSSACRSSCHSPSRARGRKRGRHLFRLPQQLSSALDPSFRRSLSPNCHYASDKSADREDEEDKKNRRTT